MIFTIFASYQFCIAPLSIHIFNIIIIFVNLFLNFSCDDGWLGALCDECIPDLDCQNGQCNETERCICNQDWDGDNCDQGNILEPASQPLFSLLRAQFHKAVKQKILLENWSENYIHNNAKLKWLK